LWVDFARRPAAFFRQEGPDRQDNQPKRATSGQGEQIRTFDRPPGRAIGQMDNAVENSDPANDL
jgi:hypothetical protein